MLNLKRKILIFFLIIILQTGANSYTKLFEPNVPDNINVIISWKYLKEYTDFLNRASKNPRAPIPQEFKKNFKSKIYYLNKKQEMITLPARSRITGDWQDHIDVKKKISSLKINLRKNNIGNIVKFRLLLNKSRDFDTEIFWSTLLEVLGYPILYKKIVNVSINGLPHEKMLFEESPSKEFLERFSFRELPILEIDEREYWHFKHIAFQNCSNLIHRTSYVLQNQCIKEFNKKKNYDEGKLSFNWKVDNKAFLKNKTAYRIGLNAILNKKKEKPKNFESFYNLNKNFASHGLSTINLKKIYDPIYNIYIPIYYDGNVYKEDFKSYCDKDKINYQIEDKYIAYLKKVQNLYFLRTGKKIDQYFQCVAEIILTVDTNYFSLTNVLKDSSFIINYYDDNQEENNYPHIRFDQSLSNSSICFNHNSCKKISSDIIKEVIAGDYYYSDKKNEKIFPKINSRSESNINIICYK